MSQIPAGYKQTEVGVIPVEWEVKNIIDTSTMKARIGWQGLTVAEYLESGDFLLVTGTDFDDGKIKWDSCSYVAKERYIQDKNIQLKDGDILITKDGTIGKIAYIDKLPLKATLNSGVFVVRPKDSIYKTKFMFYIFNSIYFNDFLRKLVAGSTISHLYQKDFVTFNYPLPPKHEQEAIAEVLSDADALIEATRRLIEKKRLIKQGVMQHLLTPKDDWEYFQYDKLFIKRNSKNYQIQSSEYLDSGKYPVVDQGKSKVIAFSDREDKKFTITKQAIIVFGDHTREIKLIDFDFIVGADGTQLLEAQDGFDINFLYYSLMTKEIPNTGYNRHFKFLKELVFAAPRYQEQTRIAAILSDMDEEIEALESKLFKQIQIKEAMMQNLLTGKVRLV